MIVALGRHALDCFAPGLRISQVHGRALEHDGRLLYPLYHPAAAFRVRSLRETMFEDVGRLPEVLASARRRG